MNILTALVVIGAFFCAGLQQQVAAQEQPFEVLKFILDTVGKCHDATDPKLDEFAFLHSLTICVVDGLRDNGNFDFIPEQLAEVLNGDEVEELVRTLDECNQKYRHIKRVERRLPFAIACLGQQVGNSVIEEIFGVKKRPYIIPKVFHH